MAGPSTRLELANVDFLDAKPSHLDVKLINPSGGTAFVTEANLHVEKIWTLIPPYASAEGGSGAAFAAPTHGYKVHLPASGAPYTVSKDLSQSIKSNETDRFTLNLNAAEGNFGEDYVFLITVTLLYNDGRELKHGVLFAPQPSEDLFYEPGKDTVLRADLNKSDAARLLSQNKRTIEEIEHTFAETEAVKNRHLEELIRNISSG